MTLKKLHSWLSKISEVLTGEEELLFEQLEVLHSGLFAVAMAFFFSAAVLVGSLNAQFQEWNFERRRHSVSLPSLRY